MKTLSAVVTTLAALAALSAQAHTELTLSVPADGATVAVAPEKLELRFSEPVRLTALAIRKGDAPKQDLAPLPAGDNAQFAVALPAALDVGHYAVTWRALSEDTHVVSGEFTFTVGAGAGVEADAGHAAPPDASPAAPPAGEPRAAHDGAH
jgi:methionine-rich copper-binding protein CopC